MLFSEFKELNKSQFRPAEFGRHGRTIVHGKKQFRLVLGKHHYRVPATGLTMRIVDKNDNEVPTGEPGEIVVRRQSVMAGYWREEAKTKEPFKNGWHHTGDSARMDRRELGRFSAFRVRVFDFLSLRR